MTASIAPARPDGSPTPLRWRPPSWLLTAVVTVVALVATDALAQALAPFIRRDDWPYLLPDNTPAATDVVAKNLNEGRWLNSVWWYLVGQHSTALSASLTFPAAYVVFVVGLWRLLRPAGRRLHWAEDAVMVVAVFASALWVRLLYWPGTLVPS